jgi:hypothetical protein
VNRARVAVGALALAVLLAPAAAGAQVYDDVAGYPLRRLDVTLQRGRTYMIFTDSVPGTVGAGNSMKFNPADPAEPEPDPVLALTDLIIDGFLPDEHAVVTRAGADGSHGCGTGGGWYPSCFLFTVPGTFDGSTITYSLWLWAYDTLHPGRTSLYVRNQTTGVVTNITGGQITFGGGRVNVPLSATSPRFALHTVLRPGWNRRHEIWQIPIGAGSHVIERRYRENGRVKTSVAATALVDKSPGAAGMTSTRWFVYGTRFLSSVGGPTPSAAKPGPVRLVRNDVFGVDPAIDRDGDGLTYVVEQALGTCDRPEQTISAGGTVFRCDSLANCAGSPTSPYCLAALRDSDHDGLRDDVEVFGLNHSLLLFPLWGADPAHADVFLELDTYDQNNVQPNCQGLDQALDLRSEVQGGTGARGLQFIGGGADFFGKMQAVFQTYPARYNPDGQPGIALHWDVGIANPDYPADTRWGDWGGGNTCLTFDIAQCGYAYAWDPNDTSWATRCGLPAGSPEPMNDLRKPFFRYGVDGPLGGTGQAIDVKLSANGLASWAHELMHSLGLGHGGPYGTAGALHDHNGRPQYASRINYRYANAGGLFGYRDGVGGVQWFSRFGLSDGSRRTLVFPNQANETCTFGSDDFSLVDPLYISVVEGWFEAPFISGGCASFDWNHDGDRVDTGVRIVDEPYTKIVRRWSVDVDPNARSGRPAIVPVRGDASTGSPLVMLFPSGGNSFQVRFESNGDCEEFTVPRPRGPGRWYPPCFRPGTLLPPISTSFPVHGVAGASITHATNNLLVVLHAGADLRFATMRVSTAPTTNEGLIAAGYTFATVPGAPAPRNVLGARDVSLVSLDGGGNTLLGYLDSSGTRIRLGRYVTSTGAWSAFFTAKDEAGADLNVRTTPALALFAGKVVMVTTDASNRLVAYELAGTILTPPEQRPWRLVGLLPNARAPARTLWSPSAAPFDRVWKQSPTPAAETQLRVVFVDSFAPGEPLRYIDSTQGSTAVPWLGVGTVLTGGAPAAGLPSTIVWDDRPSLTGRRLWPELRLWSRRGTRCSSGADCGAGGSCDTARQRCRSGTTAYTQTADWLPLMRGADPAVGADYDDAPGVHFYMCEYLDWVGRTPAQGGWGLMAHVESVLPADPYRPVALSWQPSGCGVSAACRCGAAPIFEEPTASGWALLAAPNPATDRANRPEAYQRPEWTCE